jgi:hypothetical protein
MHPDLVALQEVTRVNQEAWKVPRPSGVATTFIRCRCGAGDVA